jgi:hypothetical protein
MLEFIKAAFSAIPHVVGDTKALIAYAIACTAWTVVALRVNRNRTLLRHLEKLPEGQRLRDLQMEMGALPLPKGMTPSQYI